MVVILSSRATIFSDLTAALSLQKKKEKRKKKLQPYQINIPISIFPLYFTFKRKENTISGKKIETSAGDEVKDMLNVTIGRDKFKSFLCI